MRPRRRLSRRMLLGAAAGTYAAAAALGVWRWLAKPGATASAPILEATSPGPVGATTLAALVAAARTVIDKPVEPAHYEEYFRWRAEHLPGYLTLYERFAAQVERDARRRGRCAFAECAAADRARIVAPAARARDPRSLSDRVWAATVGRTWAAYDRFIFDEALALFADTDVWVLAGYEGWPGTPRVLDRYRRAPR